MKSGFYLAKKSHKLENGLYARRVIFVDYNKYQPHYGKQAAERNLKHKANHTHGL